MWMSDKPLIQVLSFFLKMLNEKLTPMWLKFRIPCHVIEQGDAFLIVCHAETSQTSPNCRIQGHIYSSITAMSRWLASHGKSLKNE